MLRSAHAIRRSQAKIRASACSATTFVAASGTYVANYPTCVSSIEIEIVEARAQAGYDLASLKSVNESRIDRKSQHGDRVGVGCPLDDQLIHAHRDPFVAKARGQNNVLKDRREPEHVAFRLDDERHRLGRGLIHSILQLIHSILQWLHQIQPPALLRVAKLTVTIMATA